jgi:hypothetical protein
MARWQVTAAAGGLLVAVAAFLVWITVEVGGSATLQTSPGIDQSEGRITLAAGVVVVAAAGLLSVRGRAGQWAPLLGVAASILAAIVMFVALVDVQSTAGAALAAGSAVSIGIGVWLTGIGALVALIGFARSVGSILAQDPMGSSG